MEYTLSEIHLGYGRCGSTVRRGTHEGRRAAVKLFPEHDNEVKELALQNLKNINSDFVVRYFKTETKNGNLMIFMEHCDGSLVDYLAFRKNPNSPEFIQFKTFVHCDFSIESKRLIKDMIKGLYVLHDQKCVHGDIRPNNILIAHRERWRAKIDLSITSPGVGTRGWRSAEFNPGPISAAGDIFSLGLVIFYYISGGRHPYGGNDDYECEKNILKNTNKNISLPQEASKEARELMTSEARNLIAVMLHRDPRKRPAAKSLLKHPFFWSYKKAMDFFETISSMLFSGLVKYQVEANMNKIASLGESSELDGASLGELSELDGQLMDEILRLSKDKPPGVRHLLRGIQNSAHHFYNYGHIFGISERGVHDYFSEKLPNLLTELYWEVWADNDMRKQPGMERFFG